MSSQDTSQGRWVLVKNDAPTADGIGSLPFFLKHTASAKGGRHGPPDLQNHFLLAIKLTIEEKMDELKQRMDDLMARVAALEQNRVVLPPIADVRRSETHADPCPIPDGPSGTRANPNLIDDESPKLKERLRGSKKPSKEHDK